MTRSRVSVIFATLVITLMVFIFFPEGAYGASSMPVGMDGIVAGEEKYNSGDAAEAIKIFMHVAENAAEEHDYRTECLSEFNIGVVYLSLYSNGEALQHFQKAYDLCRRHNLGPGREVEIMSGISGAFFQSNSYAKANAMFVSSRNELIEDLLKQLDSIREEKQEISNLRSYLARLISNDSKVQEEFMTNVEASDPELSRRLMASHPDLLQSDLKP